MTIAERIKSESIRRANSADEAERLARSMAIMHPRMSWLMYGRHEWDEDLHDEVGDGETWSFDDDSWLSIDDRGIVVGYDR